MLDVRVSQHGAAIDVFSGSVEEQHVPYMHPCENGSKADVRWMALRRGEGGMGVLFQAEEGAPFEVRESRVVRPGRVPVYVVRDMARGVVW